MQIFGIYNELSKQLILNPANNRDPRLFMSEEDAKEYLNKEFTPVLHRSWLKVVELDVHVIHKPTVRILPSKRPAASTSYPFVVSIFEGGKFIGVLEDFRTIEDAKAWAQRNGYQVLEEQ